MGDREDDTADTAGFASAQAEKEAMYPDAGFVLAEIDMLKPPGEALTRLNQSLLLSELTVPPSTELTDYVVYDADGHDYGHTSLQAIRDRVDARAVDELIADVQSEALRDRRLALFGLAELATESPDACQAAVPMLESELQAGELDIRATALDILVTLSKTTPEHVTPTADAVIELIDSESEQRIRRDAIRVVAAIADHDPNAVMDAAPALAVILQEKSSAASLAIKALRRIATAYPDAVVPAAPELRQYVEDSDSPERIGAIAVLGAISKTYPNVAESTIPVVSELLTVSDDRLRANAAGLLADLAEAYPAQVQPVVPQAIELLADEDEKARSNATSILARVAKAEPTAVEPAVDPLIDILDDELSRTRANACWALENVIMLAPKSVGQQTDTKIQYFTKHFRPTASDGGVH